jgi:hypothetical protein
MKLLPIDKEALENMLTEALDAAAEARDKAQKSIEQIAKIKAWLSKQEVAALTK